MGGLLTFGSIGGAVEHVFTAMSHAAHGSSLFALCLAFGGLCFFVRHYGVVTLSDLSKLLSALARAIQFCAKVLLTWSKRLSAILDGRHSRVVDPSDAQIPTLARLRRAKTFERAFIAVSCAAIAIGLAAVAHKVMDTKLAEAHPKRLRPVVYVKFADRYDALYAGQAAIGGPAQGGALSLEQFSGPERFSPVLYLNSPFR